MSQLNSNHAIETNPANNKPTPTPEKGKQDSPTKSLHGAELAAASLEMARLEAQISKEQENYQKRPKRKSLGARAQEYRFAAYVESWRQKVEKIGNLNYPEAAREQKIYGQLQMTVYIKSDGNLEKIEIKRSSGFPVLDEAAKHIVEMGAPYAAFPDDIRKDVDILDITRTWTFTKEDSLTSRGLE
jgi:protein TonB